MLPPVQNYQYSTHIFIIPKQEGNVRFITDCRRLNQQLVINPHELPKIGDTMQQVKIFQYATALDFNTGYYTKRFLPVSQDTTKIFTKFGKSKYNFLLMGLCASGDIFQESDEETVTVHTNGSDKQLGAVII